MKKITPFNLFIGLMIFFEMFSIETFAQFVAPRILQHPSQINLVYQNRLNSRYRETNLSISPDGKYLFFMSGRGGMTWSTPFYTTYKGKPEFDGDVWYSNKVAGEWQYPRCLDNIVNTESGEDEPNVSPDGQMVYFQSWRNNWENSNGPYYQSQLNGASWGRPVGMGSGINSFFKDEAHGGTYATDGATMSPDGKTFIVAAGIDYQGAMDLYISRKDGYGNWSYMQRLPVSSIEDERSPFLAADGKTLYFASSGYAGWGGLDIFKTVLNADGSHGEIVNIGSPFNTDTDDYGFILTAAGNEAYFVRDGDIYFADITNASPEIKPGSTLIVNGIVTNAITKKGMGAMVKIVDSNTKQVIGTTLSNSITGEYVVVIPNLNTSFDKEISQQGFDKNDKHFDVEIQSGLNQIISNVELNPLGQVTVVKKKNVEAAADMGLN